MCQGCPPSSYNLQYLYNPGCTDCNNSGCISAADVGYKGPLLSCTGIQTDDSLEIALQKLDERVCGITGDYTGFNFACLSNISGEQSFVESISSYVCALNTGFTSFRDTTYSGDQVLLDSRLGILEKPTVTGCSTYLSFSPNDSLQTTLNKLSAGICSIHNTELNLSAVTWSNCLSVSTAPTTIPGAFQLIADQLCAIQTTGVNVTLPTFNNTGSCLPTPGSSDSLVNTIEKIKTRVCQAPSFDINTINWGCTAKPSTTATDLQNAFQSVVDGVNDYKQNKLFFSADFVLTQHDNNSVCGGKTIALATPINQDRFVAATVNDTTPGTLEDKLEEGTGITLDTGTPGKIVISATSTSSDGKTAIISGDTPGFLAAKITGGANDGITINPAINGTALQILAHVNFSTLVGLIFDELEDNTELRDRFCQIVSSCPSPCSSPKNPQAVIVS